MAGLTLTKGSNLSLTKTDPGLNKVLVGLGWDPAHNNGRRLRPGCLGAAARRRRQGPFLGGLHLLQPARGRRRLRGPQGGQPLG